MARARSSPRSAERRQLAEGWQPDACSTPPFPCEPRSYVQRDCQAATRETQRRKLSLRLTARFQLQSSRANSMTRPTYPGPTRAVVSEAGTMSSRIARELDCFAICTRALFGSGSFSGSIGTCSGRTRKNFAAPTASASNQASIARTAIRKAIPGLLFGNKLLTSFGAHDASASRSRTTSHRPNLAAAW